MRPIKNVNQLLELYDTQFVHAIYQTILLRSPDVDGKAHLLNLLRMGADKGTILLSIATGHEARLANVFLPGLPEFIIRRRRERIFLIGFLFKFYRIISGCLFQLNRIENAIGSLAQNSFSIASQEALSEDKVSGPDYSSVFFDEGNQQFEHFHARTHVVLRRLRALSKRPRQNGG